MEARHTDSSYSLEFLAEGKRAIHVSKYTFDIIVQLVGPHTHMLGTNLGSPLDPLGNSAP